MTGCDRLSRMSDADKPFKNYVVGVSDDGDYEIYCTADPDKAFAKEAEWVDKYKVLLRTESAGDVYMFGAEDLRSILYMYGHHFGESDPAKEIFKFLED